MSPSPKVKTAAKRGEFNFALWTTIGFFGLLPIALALSLALAQYAHLVH